MNQLDPKTQGIAQRLRLAREQAGLSQAQVARMLQLHRPSISEAEAGRRKVSAEEMAEMGRIYSVSVEWLLNGASDISNADQDRIELAARKLAQMKPEDIDRLLDLLKTLSTKRDDAE